MYVYIYRGVYIYMCVYTYMYMHIYIYTQVDNKQIGLHRYIHRDRCTHPLSHTHAHTGASFRWIFVEPSQAGHFGGRFSAQDRRPTLTSSQLGRKIAIRVEFPEFIIGTLI